MLKFYFRLRRVRRRVRRKPLNTKKYKENKEKARDIVLSRLEFFNKHYGFKIGKVAIRNQRSRWGSCSSKGNLNFNYRIAHIPAHLQDYIVVHELCHLKEFNHSQKFWDLVAGTVPDWENSRAELQKIKM